MVYEKLTNAQFKVLDDLKRIRKNHEASPNTTKLDKAQAAWDAVKPKLKSESANKNA